MGSLWEAIAKGQNEGSVAKTHFSILQLCLKDCGASSLCAVENSPWAAFSEKGKNSLTLGLFTFDWFNAVVYLWRQVYMVLLGGHPPGHVTCMLGCRHSGLGSTCVNNPGLFGIVSIDLNCTCTGWSAKTGVWSCSILGPVSMQQTYPAEEQKTYSINPLFSIQNI